ncbi:MULTISPECIES: winged helix-turn-helix domain-containing protein [Marinobacter]|uniref:winged helix-turn-helix domain-containing protein n=1 Tax=Marinobacter TaxID=2742 RepID=UPI0012464CF8|nr:MULTISPECIES: winged helix-turn-helix domain-containing protein [Marinobacter]MBL3556493.1 winged helix-turn-helix domain-containing protein [Marinobacter sp. JB05H06]
MPQRMSDLLIAHAQQTFVGRIAELAILGKMLEPQGPRIVHVHGIAGIGKSTLLTRFASVARAEGAKVILLDCRHIEPTEQGVLRALGEATGGPAQEMETVVGCLGRLGGVVVLAFDTFEVFRLLDTWLRQVFIPMLPENVRVVLVGREPPAGAWYSSPGWGQLMRAVPVSSLSENEAGELLRSLGVSPEQEALIARSTHGHPLALKLAAAAMGDATPEQWPAGTPIQHALDELTLLFLDDVNDTVTTRVLEGSAVVRRVTISLLQALFPDLPPREALDRLRRLPFVDATSDGLMIHEAVREAIARSLHASDPERYLTYRRSAWRQLTREAGFAGDGDLWRYTADVLFLIENPVVREAFFPSGSPVGLSVETARAVDEAALTDILHAREGAEASGTILTWWRRLPRLFSVVRTCEGPVVGFYCKFRSDEVEPGWLLDDPITEQWYLHLKRQPMPREAIALFCRRWLSVDDGDSPGDVQAAVWLDLKRAYMELRPRLRRVYLTITNLEAYGAVARRLGFEVLADRAVVMDGRVYHSAVLDFGPASVDGWLADLAAAELGVEREHGLLDVDARELVLDERRVALTPLEFGVMRYLVARRGKAVSRSELLRDVWGTSYEGGSNVVDAVVRTLRRKLGAHASRIETVTGVGYRLREP